MRSGRLFWGVLFLQLGIIFFLENLGYLAESWTLPWDWWPLVVILIGLGMIFRTRMVRSILVILAALLLGFLVTGVFHFGSCFWWNHGGRYASAKTQEFVEPIDAGVERAKLSVDIAAGELSLAGTTADLLAATVRSNAGNYNLATRRRGELVDAKLSQNTRSYLFGRGIRNDVDIRLNELPVWELAFDVGASKMEADLSRFRTEAVSIDAGAASVEMKIGSNLPYCRVLIDAGAASIRLLLPEGAGCELDVDTGLSSSSFAGFEERSEGIYRTENYDSAGRIIQVVVDAGASSIRVERY